VETEESLADLAWHEIHNAYRTRRILTGFLGGLEQTDTGKTLAIVEYKGFRVVIPLKEMVIGIPNNLSGRAYADMILSYNKLLSNMMGCEIDFVVKGIDSKTRSIVASRKEAMLRKRRDFYFEPDDNGNCRVYPGRVIQVRVILVTEKAIRIEAFGAECTITARDLSWDWIGDARDRYSVGDQILVRITEVKDDTLEGLTIKADAKSVSGNKQNNLSLVRVQSKYAGKVTDIHKGTVYVRLTNGVNAIAHSCYDRRTPGKKDDVSFAVTAIDENRGVALGIITRIIRQNL
jgi:ribosomal protein S1